MSFLKSDRKSYEDWSVEDVFNAVRQCFCGELDDRHVRATASIHNAHDELPKADIAEWQGLIEIHGYDTIPPISVFYFDFDDSDRFEHDHGDPQTFLRGLEYVPDARTAQQSAKEWVGEAARECSFMHIPGAYQCAFYQVITGVIRDWGKLPGYWFPQPDDPARLDDPNAPNMAYHYPPTLDGDVESTLIASPEVKAIVRSAFDAPRSPLALDPRAYWRDL